VASVEKEDGEWDGTAQGYITVSKQTRLFVDDDNIQSVTGTPAGHFTKDGDSITVQGSGSWPSFAVTGSGIKAQDEASNITFKDNYVKGSVNRGIASYVHFALGYGDNLNIKILHNTILDTSFSIVLGLTDGFVVSDNYCEGNPDYESGGTFTFQGSDSSTQNGVISDNTFFCQDPNQNNIYASYTGGMFLKNIQIVNNTFRSTSLTSSTHEEILFGNVTVEGILIADNISENTNVVFLEINTLAASLEDVRVSGNVVRGLDRIGRVCRVIGFPASGPTYTNCSAGSNTFSGTSPTLQEYNNLDDVEAAGNDGVDTLPDGWVSLDSEPMLRTITLSRTLTSGDETFIADAPSVAIVVTLPASPATRKTYTIKSTNSTAGITVDGDGKAIDGDLTPVALITDQAITIQYDGTEWRVL
jgi:hypothetical protein